jgi:hypothetical protein
MGRDQIGLDGSDEFGMGWDRIGMGSDRIGMRRGWEGIGRGGKGIGCERMGSDGIGWDRVGRQGAEWGGMRHEAIRRDSAMGFAGDGERTLVSSVLISAVADLINSFSSVMCPFGFFSNCLSIRCSTGPASSTVVGSMDAGLGASAVGSGASPPSPRPPSHSNPSSMS